MYATIQSLGWRRNFHVVHENMGPRHVVEGAIDKMSILLCQCKAWEYMYSSNVYLVSLRIDSAITLACVLCIDVTDSEETCLLSNVSIVFLKKAWETSTSSAVQLMRWQPYVVRKDKRDWPLMACVKGHVGIEKWLMGKWHLCPWGRQRREKGSSTRGKKTDLWLRTKQKLHTSIRTLVSTHWHFLWPAHPNLKNFHWT